MLDKLNRLSGRRLLIVAEPLERRALLSANVLSNHNDAGSTGEDLDETVLAPSTVSSTEAASSVSTNFGRLFDTTLDGQVYAQPLTVSNVDITRGSSQGIHDVLYVATMNDSLYAVDANTGAILWQDNFTQISNPQVTTIGSPVPTEGVIPIPAVSGDNALVDPADVGPELGILATPTIDPSTNILYLVAATQEYRNGVTPVATFTGGTTDIHYVQRLWAIDISDGSVAVLPTTNPGNTVEPATGGQIIADTILDPTGSNTVPTFTSYTGYEYVAGPYVKGSGDNGKNDSAPEDGWVTSSGDAGTPWGAASKTPMADGYVVFNALLQMNRVATTLINGEIYLGFASHGDAGPYYGWLLGYNASTLANNVAWVSAPTYEPFSVASGDDGGKDAQAGFWNAGATITTDGTYLYISTGNGAFNPDPSDFSSTFTSNDNGHIVQLPLDDDYGDAVLKLQFDPSANQSNINISTGLINDRNGAYNPDGGYDTNGYGLKVVDFFTPSNVFEMNENDEDLGSGGVMLIPSTGPGSATAPDGDPMLVTAGKEGRIYLLDADNLGGYNTQYVTDGYEMDATNSDPAADPAKFDRILGEYYYAEAIGTIDSSTGLLVVENDQAYGAFDIASYFDGEVYIGLRESSEIGFSVSSLLFPPGVAPQNRTSIYAVTNFTTGNNISSFIFGSRGTTATISADGLADDIVWNVNVSQSSSDYLVAYDPSGNVLFNSNWTISGQSSNTTDTLENGVSGATGVKFSIPTVFNGMVYVGTGGGSSITSSQEIGTITGYGLLSTQLTAANFSAPTALVVAATSSTEIHLTWTSNSPLATEFEIDRSSDGVNWTVIQYVPSAVTSFDDTIPAGASFFYRVRAISGSSTTSFSESEVIAGNNNYYLRTDPNNSSNAQLFFSATPTGTPAYVFSLSSLASLAIDASAPGDQLTVDFSNNSPIPASGVSFLGSASPLIVIGGSTNSIGISASAVTLGASIVSFGSVSSITIDGGAGNDTLTQTAQPPAPVIFNGGGGDDTLIINAGLYTFAGDPQASTSSLTVDDNSSLLFTAAAASSGINVDNLASLNLGPSATATFGTSADAADRLVLVTGSLSLSATARLDEGDNDMIVHNGADMSPSLFDLLQQGSNFGNGAYWNGSTGITSSAAAANPSLTALGMELNSPNESSFDGVPVTSTDALIKYTYVGDTNLSGTVDNADYLNINAGFTSQSPGWQNGDFNYDGVINGDDYTLIDDAFNTQPAFLPAVVAEQIAAAPMPVSTIAHDSIPFAVNPWITSSEASSPFDRRRVRSIWSDLNL